MKKAGYDALIIKGRSNSPSVLLVEDRRASVEDGSKLWGLNVREANERLKELYGGASTAVIGPAGERLSKIASIDCEERQAARTGLGAVMGSKNLKAIAVKGGGELEFADPEALEELRRKWSKILKEHPATPLDMKYGTAEFYDWVNREKGAFPSRNWQHGYFKKSYDGSGGTSKLDPYYWAPRYTVRNRACPDCNKPCGRIIKVPEGRYAGIELDGLEYETIYSLGGSLDIDDPGAVAYLHLTCDLLGLDAISAGLTLAWAMEARERGLLADGDLDGVDLKFGDAESAAEALRRMAHKEGGLGALLGDGSRLASERLGKGSERFAMQVKGLELPAYDARGLKGVALAFAVSTRGGCHLTGGVYGAELSGKWWRFEGVDRFSHEGKGFEVKIHEDLMTVYDVVGICKFSRHMFYIEGFPELVNAVTGFNLSVSTLLTVGERVYNLQRAFNVREGFRRKDDGLPERILTEPIPEGKSKGSFVAREELEEMLDEYYAARGWSKDGVPTKAKLVALDLPDVAEEVGAPH